MKQCLTKCLVLAALLHLSAWASEPQQGKLPSGQMPKYSVGSPEAVVHELLKFDFKYGDRADPDRYQEWLPLTTNGEPELKNAGYWKCAIYFIAHSYKVLGKESISPDRALVLVELEALAISATPETLSRHIDQCYWPEQSLSVHDSASGKAIHLAHPLTASGFINLISGNEVGEDFLSSTDPAIKDKEHLVIPVKKERRRWQFKVDVVHQNGKWQILSDLLPKEIIRLSDEVAATKARIRSARKEIQVCSGALPPPSNTFKQYGCPPSAFPEKKLVHNLNTLKILEAIQGGQK